MTQVKPSAGMPPLVSRERVGNVVGAALHLFVGRNRRYSVKQLSNATGVKDRVIECAMVEACTIDWRPLPAEALLSIAAFLGPDFTNEWLPLAGQGAFDLPESGNPHPGQVAADATSDAAEIARRAADGVFCADDRSVLAVVGHRKITSGMRLVAAGRAVA